MRKLASVKVIEEVKAIPEADRICAYRVDGWWVVDTVGKYQPGDQAIYCEIDSWIPTEIAPFLTKPGHFPKVYNDVEGERLKTVKLRGQLSQGLLLPLGVLAVKTEHGNYLGDWDQFEGHDVSERLNIQKWEAPIPAQLAGQVRGNFPTAVPKTDQERVQNLKKDLEKWKTQDLTWEVTEKLEGSSCTMYLPVEGDFEVCSRNLSLKKDENNSFWKVAIQYDVAQRMYDAGLAGYAIQGELIGEGVQGNIYKLKGQDFYVYDIYDTNKGVYLSASERVHVCKTLGLKHVPVLVESDFELRNASIEDLLNTAEGKSVLLNTQEREGIVFKCVQKPDLSFKAISNKYLVKQG